MGHWKHDFTLRRLRLETGAVIPAHARATILSILTFLEGIGFSLLFTTAVLIVGRLLLQRVRLSVLHYVGAAVCVFMAALTVWEMTR